MMSTINGAVVVVLVLDSQKHQLRAVGEDQASLLLDVILAMMLHQPLVSREDDRVEHGLVEEEVAHPLRDDDVHLVHRKRHLLHLSLYDCDHILALKSCYAPTSRWFSLTISTAWLAMALHSMP